MLRIHKKWADLFKRSAHFFHRKTEHTAPCTSGHQDIDVADALLPLSIRHASMQVFYLHANGNRFVGSLPVQDTVLRISGGRLPSPLFPLLQHLLEAIRVSPGVP